MVRRRKFMQPCSKRSNSSPLSSRLNRQKPFSRKQQRRRLRRKQRRMKIQTRSRSMTTQIAVDAFDMLHISTESNIKPLEFIERDELTRQHALSMPDDQRPVIVLRENRSNRVFPIVSCELLNDLDEDYHSSYV